MINRSSAAPIAYTGANVIDLESAEINTRRLEGPCMVISSPVFQRQPGRGSFALGTPERARAWVLKEALLGSRWIKVYNSMDEDCLRGG